ncbi:MAG: hypothetical protein A2086_08230 [Spirochaetes bacterium GWD1_27_9]|nr:MAG: hypothetical protein A2Z98_07555 [Spirochaetes bacterium GWB1_27_13]OHD26421.1 MAG: hypothetical protein A2Y34_13640 [Spirochaetes bacterium GWC1_27_15]OHD34507.1 MAG: hypothetical protein A2086_08230 [Spirochaetes bacterium GWD1_27_9]
MKKFIIFFIIFFSFSIFAEEWKSLPLKENIKLFTSGNYKVAYKFFGDTNKETILLFYGFGGNLEMINIMSPYITKNYNLLVVDYPCHGYSPKVDNFEVEEFTNVVKKLLDSLSLNKVYLAGYSFGGIVSLDFYTKNKPMIKKLILLHTSSNFCDTPTTKFFYKNFEKMLEHDFDFTIKQIAMPILRDRYFSNDLLKLSRTVAMYNNGESVIDNYKKIIYKNYDFALLQVECPTLIIGSKIDLLVPEETSKRIHTSIKNSKLIIAKDYGHLSIVSVPQKVASEIVSFLEE